MIQVEELVKRFVLPGGETVEAVRGVSFSVEPGTVFGLLGPNGAGKTTLLRMVLGLLEPTSGHAVVDGFRSSQYPTEVKRRIGLVSTSAGVYPNLTVREMLLFFADLYAVPRQLAQESLDRLTDKLGIASFIDRPCATLSTGQKQRINLARALIHAPPVILLDEPTLGLDVMGSQVVAEFVEHLRDEGKAVILCTHRLDEAERLCTRFGLLHRGKIVSEGTLQELRERSGCSNLVEMFLKLASIGPLLQGTSVETYGG